MKVMAKIKAYRNKTICLSDEEKADMEKVLLSDSEGRIINRVINADLMSVIDEVPDSFADLIILDPPYNLPKRFNSSRFKSMSDEDYVAYMEEWFPRICMKLKPCGSMYICGDWKISALQYRVISKYLTILNRITWQREKGRGAKENWKNSMEDIWFAVKDRENYYFDVDAVKIKRYVLAPYTENGEPKGWHDTGNGKFRMTYPSNFWDDITVPFWSMPENTDHPTQKPEKLIAKLILASSKPGDMVFDPFAGSCTSCVVAKKLGRNYLGVEMDKEYCLVGLKRIEMASANPDIQGYRDGAFWERNTFRYQNQKKQKD